MSQLGNKWYPYIAGTPKKNISRRCTLGYIGCSSSAGACWGIPFAWRSSDTSLLLDGASSSIVNYITATAKFEL